jgi:hypothetical protein
MVHYPIVKAVYDSSVVDNFKKIAVPEATGSSQAGSASFRLPTVQPMPLILISYT